MAYVDTDPTITTAAPEVTAPESFTHEQLADISELYREEYSNLVWRAKKFWVRDPEATAQTAFANALQNWNKFKDMGAPRRVWLYKILANAALDEIRRTKCIEQIPSSHKFDFENPDDMELDSGFDEAEYDESIAHLRRALEGKPEHWLPIFVMYIDGYPYEDIARSTGVVLGTVRSTIHRVKEHLQQDPELLNALGRK